MYFDSYIHAKYNIYNGKTTIPRCGTASWMGCSHHRWGSTMFMPWAVAVHADILRYSACCATAATISWRGSFFVLQLMVVWMAFHGRIPSIFSHSISCLPLLPRPIISLPSPLPQPQSSPFCGSSPFTSEFTSANIKDILGCILYIITFMMPHPLQQDVVLLSKHYFI